MINKILRLFNYKSRKERLKELSIKYQKLMRQSYRLASYNKKESDIKEKEAKEVLKEIYKIERNDKHK